MTHIPDDVVERAANAYGDASGDHYDCLRAALRLAVEWEREQCAKTLAKRCDRCGGEEWLWAHEISSVGSMTDDTKYSCRGADYSEMCGHVAAIRARSNPSATE